MNQFDRLTKITPLLMKARPITGRASSDSECDRLRMAAFVGVTDFIVYGIYRLKSLGLPNNPMPPPVAVPPRNGSFRFRS